MWVETGESRHVLALFSKPYTGLWLSRRIANCIGKPLYELLKDFCRLAPRK